MVLAVFVFTKIATTLREPGRRMYSSIRLSVYLCFLLAVTACSSGGSSGTIPQNDGLVGQPDPGVTNGPLVPFDPQVQPDPLPPSDVQIPSDPLVQPDPLPPSDPLIPSDPIVPDNAVSLNRLLGTIDFQYKFYIASDIFTDRFTFNSSNFLNQEGVDRLVTQDARKLYQCEVIQTLYFCVIITPDAGSYEGFFFALDNNGEGLGWYEYCPSTVTSADCASDLLTTPDGIVEVTVSNTVSLATGSFTSDDHIIQDQAIFKVLHEQANSVQIARNDDSVKYELTSQLVQSILAAVPNSIGHTNPAE